MTASPPTPHELYQAAFGPRPELDAVERSRLGRIAVGTDLLCVLGGLWLVVAPIVLEYGAAGRGSAGSWNAVATGGAIALVALVRAGRPAGAMFLRVAGMILGGWLVVAPAVLGAATVGWPVVSAVGVGLLTTALAAAGLRAAIVARRLH